MKVILNDDVKHVGEMGDVKNVAMGYFRNYLFPRGLAVPCTEEALAYFETRKEEIEARKEQKRKDSASLKDKLEALEVKLEMPAGSNGKLFGAVTSVTLMNFYAQNGFEIERKKIEIPGSTIKNVGNFTAKVHLYEGSFAEVKVVVTGQVSEETKKLEAKKAAAEKKEAKEEAPTEAKAK